jgi:hypothetical protein
MQLLRLGLVNHTTLGKTFQKENKDVHIIIGMVADGGESVICIICLLICVKLNHDAKHNRFKSQKKEGAFFVQIVGDKDIVVVQSKPVGGLLNNSNNLTRIIMDGKDSFNDDKNTTNFKNIINNNNNSNKILINRNNDASDKLIGDVV